MRSADILDSHLSSEKTDISDSIDGADCDSAFNKERFVLRGTIQTLLKAMFNCTLDRTFLSFLCLYYSTGFPGMQSVICRKIIINTCAGI